MSVIDEPRLDPAGGDGAADQELRRKLRRRRKILVSPILLVALVFLVPALWGAFVGLRALAAPEAFAQYASTGVIGFTKEKPAGTRVSFGITDRLGPLPDVTVRSVQVELSDGSIATATTVSVCRREPSLPSDIMGIGSSEGDLSEWCEAVLPVAGQDLGVLAEGDSLVLTVVPLEQGPVHVTGVRFLYDDGRRSASELVPYDFRIGMPA